MPLLTLNQFTVLSDLPVTLTSLLSDPNWETISESVASSLWISTNRIYNRVRKDPSHGDVSHSLPIDRSEHENAVFLMQAMHQACISLKDKLPLEGQLKLANMVVFWDYRAVSESFSMGVSGTGHLLDVKFGSVCL